MHSKFRLHLKRECEILSLNLINIAGLQISCFRNISFQTQSYCHFPLTTGLMVHCALVDCVGVAPELNSCLPLQL